MLTQKALKQLATVGWEDSWGKHPVHSSGTSQDGILLESGHQAGWDSGLPWTLIHLRFCRRPVYRRNPWKAAGLWLWSVPTLRHDDCGCWKPTQGSDPALMLNSKFSKTSLASPGLILTCPTIDQYNPNHCRKASRLLTGEYLKSSQKGRIVTWKQKGLLWFCSVSPVWSHLC